MEAQQTPLRTAIMRIMSDMLDSHDGHGIYETGRFMDRIEQLLCDMMAAPEVMELSGSEAVFGFMAWLTTRNETTVLGPHQTVDISIIQRFIETNKLKDPRDAWAELLIHPPELGLAEFASETEKSDPASEPVDTAGTEPDTSEFSSLEDFLPFNVDVDIEEGIKRAAGDVASSKGKFKHPLGTILVEGSIEEIVQFIVKNGLHKKDK